MTTSGQLPHDIGLDLTLPQAAASREKTQDIDLQ
jgi:hypothetical protein